MTIQEKITEWCREESYYDEIYLIKLLRQKSVPDNYILTVTETLDMVYRECLNAPKGCRCDTSYDI